MKRSSENLILSLNRCLNVYSARHCTRHWGYSSEQDRHGSCLHNLQVKCHPSTATDSRLWMLNFKFWIVYRLWGTDSRGLEKRCFDVKWNRKKPKGLVKFNIVKENRLNEPLWLKKFLCFLAFCLFQTYYFECGWQPCHHFLSSEALKC